MPVGVSIGVWTWIFSGCPLVTREAGTVVPFLGAVLIDQTTHDFIHHEGLGCGASETEGVESGDVLSCTAGWGKS